MGWVVLTAAQADPWWVQHVDKAALTLTGLVAAMAYAELGKRFWERMLKPRLDRRQHIATERNRTRVRELLANSMRRVWIDQHLAEAVDPSTIVQLPVVLKVPNGVLRNGGNQTLPTLVAVWDASDRRKLRLIGEWGTGKTIHLLRLAQALLDEATPDGAQPIPVIVNVSSWKASKPFEWWLLDELARRHSLDLKEPGLQDLYTHHQLILLLDGVDEHPTPGECADAIGKMLDATPELQLVVTYRSGHDDASRLRQQEIDQHLASRLDPVEVVPLQAEQVNQLLAREGTRWQAVRQAIDEQPDLWDPLMRRPMILATLMRALQHRPSAELTLTGATLEERRDALYDLYIDRVVADRLNAGDNCDGRIRNVAEVRAGVKWLADAAARCRLGTSVYLEQLSPAWLPTTAQRLHAWRQQRAVVALIGGLVSGVFFGAAGWLNGEVGLGLFMGVPGGLLVGLSFLLLMARGNRPLTGQVSWSWSLARSRQIGRFAAVLALIGAGVMLLTMLRADPLTSKELFTILVGFLLVAGPAVIQQGLEYRPWDLGSAPYLSALRRSVLIEVRASGLVVSGYVMLTAWMGVTVFGSDKTEVVAAVAIVLLSLIVLRALLTGLEPAITYWLTQRELRRAALIPGDGLQLVDFLDWAASHNGPLLLPVGYGYRFLHPTFQDHLAASWRDQHEIALDEVPEDAHI